MNLNPIQSILNLCGDRLPQGSIVIRQKLSQRQLELDVIEHPRAEDDVLAQELLGVRRVGNECQQRVEEVVEHLDDAGLADGASLKVFHAVLPRHVDGLVLGDWIDYLLGFLGGDLASAHALIGLHDVDLVAHQDLDRYLAGALALCDPLLNAFERRSLGDIEQIDDGR